MFSILIGAIFTGVIFYTAILYKSIPLALLGYSSAALLALACLFLIYRMHTVRFWMQVPVSMAQIGSPVAIYIHVKNNSLFPCPRYACCIGIQNRFLSRERKKWTSGPCVQAGENSFVYTVTFSNYGSYGIDLKKVRLYDLTGLFYLQKKAKDSISVQVFPKMHEIGIHVTEAARNFFCDSDVYDSFRPGYDHSELFQMRPFQNGDKIQIIHWKLSAKMDALCVKEGSLPKSPPVLLLLDYQKKKQNDAKKVNVYLTIMASLSFSMLDSGCPHYVAWFSDSGNDIVRVRVDNEESLYMFLNYYLEETFESGPDDLQRAYAEKYPNSQLLHILQFNKNLELYKNQEKIITFGLKDWEEKMGGLTLVL